MNERIKEIAKQSLPEFYLTNCPSALEKFAELIVRDCMMIARNWEDQLEKSKMPSESDAVGIVAYRIARQFGVEE